MKCSQCGNNAVFDASVGPLCLNCMYKFQQVIDTQQAGQERMMNFLLDEMEMAAGVKLGGCRFPERKPAIIQHSPVTVNSIAVDRSVVGSVNTGYINQLEVEMNSVSVINQGGVVKIKKFVEAVLKEDNLDKEKKELIIQQLNFLTEQLKSPTDKRNKAVMSTVAKGVVELINFSASLLALWNPIRVLLGL